MKRWKINEYDKAKVSAIEKKCDLSALAIKVLYSRGLRDIDSIADFFNTAELADPFEIKDMQKAVDAINEAIEGFDKICIYGDYDCDGVTATTILYSFLDSIGANVMFRIPERSEGYGMNMAAIEEMAAQGVSLIVTVDNGISAIAEAEKIYELGMKLVVTDHHQVGSTLPKAEAVVDLHQADCPSKFKDLCGAGVALKLCIALNDNFADPIIEQYADICALGTIADVVPLTGENRIIVKTGLELMKNTENYGLNFIMDKASVNRDNLNSTTIAFQIAPRINASGRFGSPSTAVNALLAESEFEAEKYADMLMSLNEQRKATEGEILKAILNYIDKNPMVINRRVLILAGKNWHHGVVGIVAAKLLDMYGKPTILLSIDDDGVARGSARSIKGFNIFECLTAAADLLDHFGGHECAGGLTIEASKIPEFTKRVFEFADKFEIMPMMTVECDLALEPEDLTIPNIKCLSRLEPFGADNSNPVFALYDAKLERIFSIAQGKHSKLDLRYNGITIQAPMFGVSPDDLKLHPGDRLDLAMTLEINEYNGKQSINARIVDYRPHGINQERYFNAKECYERYMLGEELPQPFLKRINPARDELVAVYKLLNTFKSISFDELYMHACSASMNYCKLRIILDAFAETGLAELSSARSRVKNLPVTQKVDLENSSVLTKLRSKIR